LSIRIFHAAYRMSILLTSLSIIVCLAISDPYPVNAASASISATGEYLIGDNDTYSEARKLALQNAKRLVLGKKGSYIEISVNYR